MRIVVALGGNALLRRGEAMTAGVQRHNIAVAAEAIAPIALEHELIVTHGNGPQIGLLSLQASANDSAGAYPLDVLDAETEGMIGYLIEQELMNRLPPARRCATLLTQIEVDPMDLAFGTPTKPIGPIYAEDEAKWRTSEDGWVMMPDGDGYRRAVPSPRPLRILEFDVIELLVSEGIVVICAGGGGIPTVRSEDGRLAGIEAVIDKDLASALLAQQLKAERLILLTDVDAVWSSWGEPGSRPIRRASPDALDELAFAPGTMGPKVEAACEFVRASGGVAAIGRLEDAGEILAGAAGTQITSETASIEWEYPKDC